MGGHDDTGDRPEPVAQAERHDRVHAEVDEPAVGLDGIGRADDPRDGGRDAFDQPGRPLLRRHRTGEPGTVLVVGVVGVVRDARGRGVHQRAVVPEALPVERVGREHRERAAGATGDPGPVDLLAVAPQLGERGPDVPERTVAAPEGADDDGVRDGVGDRHREERVGADLDEDVVSGLAQRADGTVHAHRLAEVVAPVVRTELALADEPAAHSGEHRGPRRPRDQVGQGVPEAGEDRVHVVGVTGRRDVDALGVDLARGDLGDELVERVLIARDHCGRGAVDDRDGEPLTPGDQLLDLVGDEPDHGHRAAPAAVLLEPDAACVHDTGGVGHGHGTGRDGGRHLALAELPNTASGTTPRSRQTAPRATEIVKSRGWTTSMRSKGWSGSSWPARTSRSGPAEQWREGLVALLDGGREGGALLRAARHPSVATGCRGRGTPRSYVRGRSRCRRWARGEVAGGDRAKAGDGLAAGGPAHARTVAELGCDGWRGRAPRRRAPWTGAPPASRPAAQPSGKERSSSLPRGGAGVVLTRFGARGPRARGSAPPPARGGRSCR